KAIRSLEQHVDCLRSYDFSELSAEETIDGETLFLAEYNEAVRQRDISKEVEYVPVKKSSEVRYGNLPQNFTSETLPGLVCPDTENDILYFTNLSDKETLCKLENGIVTELLPVTAKSINLWNGYLYYICDSDNMTGIPRNRTGEFRIAYTGDIFRYNISTGENELLIETNAYTLIVSDNGLDYSAGRNYSYEKLAYNKDRRLYHADFDGGNIIENPVYPVIDSFLGIYYGEYRLEAADGAIMLRSTKTDEVSPLLSRSETVDAAALVGDILYYCPNFRNYRLNFPENVVSRNELCGIDLSTGEKFSAGEFNFMTDYAVVGGKAYLCSGVNFNVFENGMTRSAIMELHGFTDGTHEFAALYTDGERLYAADDRKGIYNIEENETGGLIYYEIGGTPWKAPQ
ncbi:MAG: DUF5050 domain-containing protein, partial [Oscillospiraceae bacterium]|nr:DUF5050 domain-containing protein [Oscillospiraceae bacterium]